MDLIVGDGLGLRLPEEYDAARWLELIRDPDQLRFGTPSFVQLPETPEDIAVRVAEARRKYAAHEPNTFVIVAEDDPQRFLGSAGWSFHLPPPLQIADVGYSVHPDSRGHGIAGRALRTLTRWLTEDDGGPRLARVQLDHSIENPASCRTALAGGFEQEGIRHGFLPLRDATAPDGVRRHDVCLHGFVPAST
jgi:RimJ/RimL family protein N-acetyltransferase